MKNRINLFLFVTACAVNYTTYNMEQNKESHTNLRVIVVAADSSNTDNNYIKNLLQDDDFEFAKVKRPNWPFQDCGQDNDQKKFFEALKDIEDKENSENVIRKNIVWARYSGGTTALNYIAKRHIKRLAALILDCPFISQNSVFEFQNGEDKSALCRFWIPYKAKLGGWYPTYNPAGESPIKQAIFESLSYKKPIIIINNKNSLVSENDIKALYYKLKSMNLNVYFLDNKDPKYIRQILDKHKIFKPLNENQNLDHLEQLKPDHIQYKDHYDNLIRKENIHEKISLVIFAGALIIVILTIDMCMNIL